MPPESQYLTDVQVLPRTSISPWMTAPVAPLQPGIGIDDRDDDTIKAQIWPVAYEQWTKSCSKTQSEQTQKSYLKSVAAFTEFANVSRMWRVMGSQVIAWQNAQREAGLAETTINLRLAGLSSLFSFLMNKFSYPDPITGREAFIVERNPVDRATRAKVDPYGKADGLGKDEIYALLRRIDRSTLIGLRDFALIVTYVATGRRSTEIAALQWKDITEKNGVRFYTWAGKGGKTGTDELLRYAYDAIVAYLKAAGRLETILPDEFIFIALSNVAARLPNVGDDYKPGQHLSGAMINRIVKKCASRAGLDPARIHTHTLRHTAADLRIEMSGGDIMSLQDFLGHSNVATTQIYVTKRKRERDPMWAQVGAFFEMV